MFLASSVKGECIANSQAVILSCMVILLGLPDPDDNLSNAKNHTPKNSP
jgi:hypothetical protein